VRPERAPRIFLAASEATAPGADKLTESGSLFPKQASATHATFERAPRTWPKKKRPGNEVRRAMPTEAGKAAALQSKTTERFSAA
jgi:hypothetical protein